MPLAYNEKISAHILVVDDDMMNLRIAEMMLGKQYSGSVVKTKI